jgi:hypothetical protein
LQVELSWLGLLLDIALMVLALFASTVILRSQSLKPGRETRIECSPIDSDSFEGVLLVKHHPTEISDPKALR